MLERAQPVIGPPVSGALALGGKSMSGGADALRSLCGELALGREALTGWSVEGESIVLSVGADLGEVDQRVRVVLKALGNLGQSLLDSRGADAVRGLEQAAKGALSLAALEQRGLDQLAGLREGVRRARIAHAEIHRLLLQLTHLGIIVRTNVSATNRTAQLLGGFAEEVSELILGGQETARTLGACLTNIDRAVSHVTSAETRPKEGASKGRTAHLGTRMHGISEALSAHRAETARLFHTAQQRFEAVGKAVADLVVRLQFHDIARQRMEHVTAELGHLLGVIEEGGLPELGGDLPPERQAHAARTLARLCVGQLRSLAQDSAKTFGGLGSSFETIARHLAEATDLCDAVYGGSRSGDGSSLIAALDAELAAVQTICAADQRERQALQMAMEACASEAGQLAAIAVSLGEFEQALRLSGLNAVVRSTKLGGTSTAIHCIAYELREQASAVKREALAIRDAIDTALGAARVLARELLPAMQSAESDLADGSQAAAAIVRDLEAVARNEHRSAAEAADGLGGRLAELASRPLGDLADKRVMLGPAGRLERLLSLLPRVDETETWPELEALLGTAYTMASERRIHAAMVHGAAPPTAHAAPPPAAAPADPDDLSDILF